ncbi:manganese ion binding protein [Aureococcus anophagefferens]|nr:manganese ion binding protein [Aureococcus anophagefferens]
MLATLLSCAPMAAQGMRFAVRRLRMQRSLRPQRPRGRVVMRLGGGAFEFPRRTAGGRTCCATRRRRRRRLPGAGPYALEFAAPPPATAALSWGLGCYSFEACKGSTAPKADAPPKFASLVVPAENDYGDAAAALKGTSTPSAAAGEKQRPRLVDLTWGAADAPRVTLVGKGVCFDTGGLDLKPAAAMLTMKKDMGGAAHVLGLAAMVMDAGLPVRLRVLIPAVENAVSGDAFRPGDVLAARNGNDEIGNTDAEAARLALVEACADAPALLVDCATLTGAGRVALGTDVPALFANEEGVGVADEPSPSAGEQDQVWRLPLWPGYREQIDSKIADLKNIGAGPYGGAITAALYLAEFVEAPPDGARRPGSTST